MKTGIIVGIAIVVILARCILIVQRNEVEAWINKPETIERIKELCKEAEKWVLESGRARLDWCIDKLYMMFPAEFETVISKPLFKAIARKVIHIVFESIAVVIDGHRVAV